MNFTVAEIEEIVHKSPKANGAYNYFVKLNDKIGIKYCCSESQRDSKMFLQSKAAKIGLGPNVYGKIDITVDNVLYYGYLTEVVKVYTPESFYKLSVEERENIHEEIDKLSFELQERIQFNFVDNHPFNIGYKNNQIVCIDFDEVGVENDLYDLYYLDEKRDHYL